ncbi:MAG: hypothetical protein Q7T86_06305 [Hyphomicrobiaceae bacterium]|nr:hypothetical protein [Hyphomicrobiaceae bacterium]
MTRTNLIASIAAVIGGTILFASAAQACISCEYVPEVLSASKDNSHRSHRPQSSYSATKEMRAQAARAQVAKAQMLKAQMLKAQMLKAQAAKAQMAKAMAAKSRAAAAQKVETASLMQKTDESAAKAPVVKTVSAKSVESSTAGSGSSREKVVSTATLLVGERVSAETGPSEPVSCKKFIAAIGTTVTMPCK